MLFNVLASFVLYGTATSFRCLQCTNCGDISSFASYMDCDVKNGDDVCVVSWFFIFKTCLTKINYKDY